MFEKAKPEFFKAIGYKPHHVQWLYHNSMARFRVACCGRRMGKSTMAARDKELTLLKPKTRAWIVGPTYDLGEKEFRVIWQDLIIDQKLGLDNRVKKSYSVKQGNMSIEFPWGSKVEVRSSDHPESLVGEGLDWVILSEAAKHSRETWEKYLRPALSDKLGTADFVTTPEGQNWLYELWRIGQNPEYREWESWQFPSWENRIVFPGGRNDLEIVSVERETTLEWFLQEYGAQFTAFVGKIFPEWDEVKNVRKVEFDPTLPNYMGVDFGYAVPSAFIEFQITPQDQIRIWREHYEPGLRLDEHIDIIKSREQPPGYHLDCAFADAADPAGADYLSAKLVGTYALPEAKKNWRQGIDRIKYFLQESEVGIADEFGTPTMEPRLFVDHSCKNMIFEFNNYRAMSEPKTGADPQDKPFKKRDHALDALRYALVHLYDLGAGRHLGEIYDINSGVGAPYVQQRNVETYIAHNSEDTEAQMYLGPRMGGETIFNFREEIKF